MLYVLFMYGKFDWNASHTKASTLKMQRMEFDENFTRDLYIPTRDYPSSRALHQRPNFLQIIFLFFPLKRNDL